MNMDHLPQTLGPAAQQWYRYTVSASCHYRIVMLCMWCSVDIARKRERTKGAIWMRMRLRGGWAV